MAKNKFDKEKVSLVSDNDVPCSFVLFDSEKTYDIRNNRKKWWQCPKCGGNIEFDSMTEDFDDSLGENQFITVYSWECDECSAHGGVYAAVNPLYISIDQDEEDSDED